MNDNQKEKNPLSKREQILARARNSVRKSEAGRKVVSESKLELDEDTLLLLTSESSTKSSVAESKGNGEVSWNGKLKEPVLHYTSKYHISS